MTDRNSRLLQRLAASGDPEAIESLRMAALREAVRIDVPCIEGGLAHTFVDPKLHPMAQNLGWAKRCRKCKTLTPTQWVRADELASMMQDRERSYGPGIIYRMQGGPTVRAEALDPDMWTPTPPS